MTYEISYEAEDKLEIDWETIIRKVIDAALDQENCPYEAEISVTITDAKEVHRINKEFRGIDRTTDVLSFPMCNFTAPADFDFLESDEAFDCFNPETGELLLGDIILSVDKIREQAESYGHSITRELAFLTAHSMLHLMGYDHMTDEDKELMEKHQRILMDTLKITRD